MPLRNRLSSLPPTALLGTGILVTSRRRQTRWQALRCAGRGVWDAWKSEPNLRLQVCAGVVIIACGWIVGLGAAEWTWLALAIGWVACAELMNTVVERLVDLTVGLRPDALARQVKDIAAGFVLVSCVAAAAIGCCVFLPHLL